MRKTQTRKATKVKYCEDVNKEFFSRFYDLLYTNYQNEEPISINTFPPMKPESEVKAEPQQAFNSRISDLRIKRSLDKKLNNKEEEEKQLKEEKEKIVKRMENNEEEIDEVFEKVGVPRANIPVYIANQQNDEAAAKKPKTKNTNQENMKDIEAEYKKRLKQSENKGRERALKRSAKLQGVKDQETFIKTFKQRKAPSIKEKPFIVKV